LRQVDPGFRADNVLTFLLDVPSHRHPGAQRPVLSASSYNRREPCPV
jgi:hypothetical protein